MSLIDRESTFKGIIVDHAVNVTTNGFEQFVCKLVAKEIYDEDERIWVDWSEEDVNEITAYLVLRGGKGETLNAIQIKKATGWDGLSLIELENMDFSEITVQFRAEYRTYQDKTTLQVTWFDEADAEPGRAVRKLDVSELKSLDAKYKSMLKSSGKKAAPAKAGTKKAVAKPGPVTKKDVKPTAPRGPVAKKSTAPPAAPAAPAADDLPAGHCTKQEAWDTIVAMKDKSVTDEANAKAYLDAILAVSGANDQDALTDEQWFQVKEIVLEANAAF